MGSLDKRKKPTLSEMVERQVHDIVTAVKPQTVFDRAGRFNEWSANRLEKILGGSGGVVTIAGAPTEVRSMLFREPTERSLSQAPQLYYGKPLSADVAKGYAMANIISSLALGTAQLYSMSLGSINEQKKKQLVEFVTAIASAMEKGLSEIRDEDIRTTIEKDMGTLKDHLYRTLRIERGSN